MWTNSTEVSRIGARPERKSGSVRAERAERERWVVVGHGMVGQRFAERIVETSLVDRIELTLIGDEPSGPYDRVHLSDVVRGTAARGRSLASPEWFERHGIRALVAEVRSIDREAHVVRLDSGEIAYDRLVLATGSRALRPPVPGHDLSGVLVYRTLADALRLRELALETAALASHPVLVVGAGLLGLEIAEVLEDLGLTVVLVETAGHLLPRQLDAESGRRLATAFASARLRVLLERRVESLEEVAGAQLVRAVLSDETTVDARFVVFTVGVRPRDELARAAGLVCDLFGGVVVNDGLTTSDPHVFALGECARYQGQSFGLVAPGYAMVETLIERIQGKKATFQSAPPSLRLKTKRADVCAFGESSADGLGITSLLREGPDGRARLVLDQDRITGLTIVGQPADRLALEQAASRGDRLGRKARLRFESGLPLTESAVVDPSTWPRSATFCACTGVTCGVVLDAYARGAVSVDALTQKTAAGSVCGSCRPLLVHLVGGPVVREPVWAPRVASAFVLPVFVLALVPVALPVARATHEAGALVEWARLLDDFRWKQLTGWSLLAAMILAGLYLVRRRLESPRLARLVDGGRFRALHLALGAIATFGFVAHTGLAWGHGFDRALGIATTALLGLGAFAALPWSVRASARATRERVRLRKIHLWLAWPLPALVLVHVVKVYWFR